MSYNVQWASGGSQNIPGKTTIILPDDSTNTTSTSLTLTGRDVVAYGQIQQTNFIQLLENFANTTPPVNSTIGQTWFKAQNDLLGSDPTANILYVCVDPDLMTPQQQAALYPAGGQYWSIASLSGITLSSLGAQLGAQPLLVSGGNMTGNLVFDNTHRVTGLPNPVNSSDAATKSYVDAVASSLIIHAPVAAATTSNLNATYTPGSLDTNGGFGVGATLTNSGANAPFAVDGYSASLNDRILVKDQSLQTQNGIYIVTTVGSISQPWVLTRANDFDDSISQTPHQVTVGAYVYTTNGSAQSGSSWVQNQTGNIVIGTDAITFVQFSSATIYSAGTGISITGNVIANSGVTSVTGGSNIQVSAATGGVTISLTGTVPSASTAATASLATTVTTTSFTGAASYPLAFLNGGSVLYNSNLTFNANTGILTAPHFTGSLTGNATSSTTSTTATNLASGGVGSVPYQTSSGNTTMLAAGANGQVLTLAGGVPTWQNPSASSGVVTSIIAGSGINVSGPTGAVTVSNAGVLSVAGTPQQVTAVNSGGNVTLSLPQSIATSSSPTFASLALGSVGISPTPVSYGSLTIGGANGGYAGIQFAGTTGNRTFMVGTGATPITGIYNVSAAQWDWFFTGNTLTQGTVPAANIGPGTAAINISGNAVTANTATSALTQPVNTNNTTIATTAFVQNQIAATGSVSPAYWCYGNAAGLSTNGTINFQTAFTNTPVNITSYVSGVVTVTVPGLYYVSASVTVAANAEPSSQGIGQLWIQHNGVLLTGAGNDWSNFSIYNNTTQYNTVTVSGLINCAAGDTIAINYNNNTQYGYVQAGYGQFTGFKVA